MYGAMCEAPYLDLAQRGEVVTHVGEHVLAHRRRHLDRLAGVGRVRGREQCAEQQGGGNNRYGWHGVLP
jgi:hypothetical protein